MVSCYDCSLPVWIAHQIPCKSSLVHWDYHFFFSSHFCLNYLRWNKNMNRFPLFYVLSISSLLSYCHSIFWPGSYVQLNDLLEKICGLLFTFRLLKNASRAVLLFFEMSFACSDKFRLVFMLKNTCWLETIFEMIKGYHFYE